MASIKPLHLQVEFQSVISYFNIIVERIRTMLSKCYDFVTPLIVQGKCHHGESDIEPERTE
jgi:hypothetical protein